MNQHHLFVLDPLNELNYALDTSLRIAQALSQRGHLISVAKISDLLWHSGGHAGARATPIVFGESIDKIQLGEPKVQPLSTFSAIHMRKDPPFDLDYIAATWLLDACGPHTKVYNSPEALRSMNEKLTILNFPKATKPGLVACDPEQLLRFIVEEANNDAIIKPLNLFGGRGVSRLTVMAGSQGRASALEALRQETNDGRSPRLVQAFDQKIFSGEVRAFAVGGNPVAWCLKVPAAGNFLANTRAGAVLKAYTPTPVEIERVRDVASALAKRGVFFVGFDLIDGHISEMNITSPRLLVGPGDTKNHYDEIATWIAKDCQK